MGSFSHLFRDRFLDDFLIAFLMDFGPKMEPKECQSRSPDASENRYFSAVGPFVIPLVRFGSPSAPFGSILAAFGAILAPILAQFWFILSLFLC